MAPQRELPSRPGQYEVYRGEIAQLVTRITRVDVEEHETGITVPARSSGPAGPVVVVVAESGKDLALLRDIVRPLADAGHRVVGLDARGWGETLPSMPEKKDTNPWDEFFTYRSLELGRPLFGKRLRDVLVTAPAAAGGNSYRAAGASNAFALHSGVSNADLGSMIARWLASV
jgi:hypothetical protein